MLQTGCNELCQKLPGILFLLSIASLWTLNGVELDTLCSYIPWNNYINLKEVCLVHCTINHCGISESVKDAPGAGQQISSFSQISSEIWLKSEIFVSAEILLKLRFMKGISFETKISAKF